MTDATRRLREAVELALAGNWQAAHEVAQAHEHDEHACWLHAVVHRIEGDLSNARYVTVEDYFADFLAAR